MKTILFPLFFSLLLLVSCSLKNERITLSDEEIVSNGRYFASDNDEIQYSGRIDFSSQGKAVFSLPAVKIRFRFSGSGISVHIKDLTTGGVQADNNPARNYFNVYIDEQKPFVMELVPNDTIYLLASGLRGDEHTAVLVKRTEALAGKVEFRGIWLEKGKEFYHYRNVQEERLNLLATQLHVAMEWKLLRKMNISVVQRKMFVCPMPH